MILDEIDKVGGATKNFGDPSAALLELLDPEQNTRFHDVYLDVPVDVSEVLFIATANDLAGIPAPLRDRLEIIEAPESTDDEKIDIVRRTLWGEQLEVSGLNARAFWTQTAALTHLERPEGASGAAPVRRRLAVEVLDEATSAVMQLRGRSGRERGPVADGRIGRGDGCGYPGSSPGPYLRGGGPALARQLDAICQFLALRRVETADTAPITVVADADEDARLDPARRRFTVAEILGPPRFDSLPDRVRDALSRERDRVLGLHPSDPEAVAAQAWIEVVEGIPWRRAEEQLDTPAPLRRTLDREPVRRSPRCSSATRTQKTRCASTKQRTRSQSANECPTRPTRERRPEQKRPRASRRTRSRDGIPKTLGINPPPMPTTEPSGIGIDRVKRWSAR